MWMVESAHPLFQIYLFLSSFLIHFLSYTFTRMTKFFTYKPQNKTKINKQTNKQTNKQISKKKLGCHELSVESPSNGFVEKIINGELQVNVLMHAMHSAAPTVYHMHAQHCMTPYPTHSTLSGAVLFCMLPASSCIHCTI